MTLSSLLKGGIRVGNGCISGVNAQLLHPIQIDGWPTVSYLAAMNFQQSATLVARVVAGLEAEIDLYHKTNRHHHTSTSTTGSAASVARGSKGKGAVPTAEEATGVGLRWQDFNLLLVVVQCSGERVWRGKAGGRRDGETRRLQLMTDVLLCCAGQPANAPRGGESELARAEAQLRLVCG